MDVSVCFALSSSQWILGVYLAMCELVEKMMKLRLSAMSSPSFPPLSGIMS